ncbi:MAG TPA: hypothetical protein V6D05_01565 [Stenomitos sp.]
MIRALVRVLLLATLLLSGCGVEPGTTVDDGKRPKDLQLSRAPLGATPDPGDTVLVQRLLSDVDTVRAVTHAMTFTVTGYFLDEKTGQAGSSLADFCYERPEKTSIKIQQSSDGKTVGTKLVWMGGKQLAVKTKFLGFWVKTSIDVHDPRAKDGRGFFIDETGITQTLDTLTDPRNQVKLLGTGYLGGVPVAQLEVVSPRSLRGIRREVFYVDGQRKIPLIREMYDQQNRMVFRVRMDHVVLNPALPPTTFQLE